MPRGSYVDAYPFEGRAGQRAKIELSSTSFDTYLIVVPPRGSQVENDDAGADVGRSAVETDLVESGQYRVLVTSFEAGETGDYELRIEFADLPLPPAGGAESQAMDRLTLSFDQPVDGALTASDGRIDSGEYRDFFSFDGQAGDRVRVEIDRVGAIEAAIAAEA